MEIGAQSIKCQRGRTKCKLKLKGKTHGGVYYSLYCTAHDGWSVYSVRAVHRAITSRA